MNPKILLKEVADCLTFALKQSDHAGHGGYTAITRARAKTLLNDIRKCLHEEKLPPKLKRKDEPAWLTRPE
jgi:hypothetical protein